MNKSRSIIIPFLLFCLLTICSSCLHKQKILQNSQYGGRGENGKATESHTTTRRPPVKPSAISASAQDYIAQYKSIAIKEMNTYGIPASITLAQGLLESANGSSILAREANNHFGIKCTPDWKGETFLQDDDRKDDCFRVYPNPEESFRDHSEFLLRKRYEALFQLNKDDYAGWARGLKKAGYATNPRYADLLIDLIERYGLYQYDQGENLPEKQKREQKIQEELIAEAPKQAIQEEQAKPPITMLIHEVRAGDTLYNISKRYGLTVQELKDLNSLPDDHLVVGQLLLVSK